MVFTDSNIAPIMTKKKLCMHLMNAVNWTLCQNGNIKMSIPIHFKHFK